MDRTVKTILTNMCMVYDDNGNVLVQDKTDKEYNGITFPGGHVENYESFTEAVIREVYEETGLKINNPRLCGIKDWQDEKDGIRYIVLFYKTNKFHGDIKSSDEGEIFWVRIDELPGMKLAEGMDKMLQVFLGNDFGEYFFYQENNEWKEKLL